MKKKFVFMFILLFMAVCGKVNAEGTYVGILLTYDGSEVCYKFETAPLIKNVNVKGVDCLAVFVKDRIEPVATFPLGSKEIVLTYATYEPTDVKNVQSEKVSITERDGKKYVSGGRLIIVDKMGKKYDSTGKAID